MPDGTVASRPGARVDSFVHDGQDVAVTSDGVRSRGRLRTDVAAFLARHEFDPTRGFECLRLDAHKPRGYAFFYLPAPPTGATTC